MVELTLKIDRKLNRIYLKKDVDNDLLPGKNDELGYIGGKLAGVLFPKGYDYQEILRSLESALTDIKHRAELTAKKEANGD